MKMRQGPLISTFNKMRVFVQSKEQREKDLRLRKKNSTTRTQRIPIATKNNEFQDPNGVEIRICFKDFIHYIREQKQKQKLNHSIFRNGVFIIPPKIKTTTFDLKIIKLGTFAWGLLQVFFKNLDRAPNCCFKKWLRSDTALFFPAEHLLASLVMN